MFVNRLPLFSVITYGPGGDRASGQNQLAHGEAAVSVHLHVSINGSLFGLGLKRADVAGGIARCVRDRPRRSSLVGGQGTTDCGNHGDEKDAVRGLVWCLVGLYLGGAGPQSPNSDAFANDDACLCFAA
jgi:hypothetical protein